MCLVPKEQEKGEQEKELVLQDEMSSRVWVCTSTQSSTKVMVLDASQPSDLVDSFYACNNHVVCIASVPGRLGSHRVCLCRLGFFVCVIHDYIIYFLFYQDSFDCKFCDVFFLFRCAGD